MHIYGTPGVPNNFSSLIPKSTHKVSMDEFIFILKLKRNVQFFKGIFFFLRYNHVFYFINQRGRLGLEIESSCNYYLWKRSKYNGLWCQGTIGWPLKSPKSEGG